MPGSLTMLGAGRRSSAPAWLLSAGGTRASLDIDFVNDLAYNGSLVSIASLLSCSRASTGYYTAADGTLQSFSSNTLRYGTNGLLVEEARTNVLLQSNTFSDASWGKNAVNATGASATSPDGTSSGWKLSNSTATSDFPCVFQTLSSGAADTKTYTVYAKAGTKNFLQALTYDGTTFLRTWFNLSNGTVGTTAAGHTATIQAVANGWYRCRITYTFGASTNRFYAGLATSDNVVNTTSTVIDADYIYIFAAQVEAGSFATSYIPTTSSSATRAADSISASSLSWYVGGALSAYCEFLVAQTPAGASLYRFKLGDGGVNNDLALTYRPSAAAGLFVKQGGSVVADISSGTIATNATQKEAVAIDTNDFAISLNAAAVGTDASGARPSLSSLYFGSNDGGSSFLNGYIRRFAYWPSRVSNANLQSLTT